jgi:hypothetical protein
VSKRFGGAFHFAQGGARAWNCNLRNVRLSLQFYKGQVTDGTHQGGSRQPLRPQLLRSLSPNRLLHVARRGTAAAAMFPATVSCAAMGVSESIVLRLSKSANSFRISAGIVSFLGDPSSGQNHHSSSLLLLGKGLRLVITLVKVSFLRVFGCCQTSLQCHIISLISANLDQPLLYIQ